MLASSDIAGHGGGWSGDHVRYFWQIGSIIQCFRAGELDVCWLYPGESRAVTLVETIHPIRFLCRLFHYFLLFLGLLTRPSFSFSFEWLQFAPVQDTILWTACAGGYKFFLTSLFAICVWRPLPVTRCVSGSKNPARPARPRGRHAQVTEISFLWLQLHRGRTFSNTFAARVHRVRIN